jgi:hypothetical protein
MSRAFALVVVLTVAVFGGRAQAAEAGVEARRERGADFEVDEAFQADGGVQLFFELVSAPARPVAGSAFEQFHALDATDRLGALKDPVHAAMSRISYVINKDVMFFNRERLFNVTYVQAIAPDMQVTSAPHGGFQVGRAPSHRFSLTFHADASGLAPAVVALARARGAPVLVQENVDFARIMGWRTGAWSTTWTFHEALGRDRTRVTVLTLSYLYNLPPFWLGGADGVYAETLSQARALIGRLRSYVPPVR